MIRTAGERIQDLFGLAESEAHRSPSSRLPDRYVALARRVGMRYNVRLLPELREFYCRGCSSYWVEGRTVRTRLRAGRRVRTCLRCGRVRRVRVHGASSRATPLGISLPPPTEADEALVEEEGPPTDLDADEGEDV